MSFNTVQQTNLTSFLSAVDQNVSAIKSIGGEGLDKNKLNEVIGNFEEFAANNKDYMATNYEAYTKFRELARVVSSLDTTDDQHGKIMDIGKQALAIRPEKPKRKKRVGAGSGMTPGRIQRATNQPTTLFPLDKGQQEGLYKPTGESYQTKKGKTIPMFSITSKESVGKIGNTYTTTKMIAKAGEATIYLAKGSDGELHAIREVHLMPTKTEKSAGAPDNPGLDVKRGAEFEQRMREADDGRIKHLCLKTEVIVRRSGQYHIPEYAYQVMPLAEMSVNNLALKEGKVTDAYANLSPEQQVGAAAYVGKQMLTGLSFLHGQKQVHHDTKLENLLLMKDGTVKLTDYGFTKTFSEKSKMLVEGMNPQFISPELARGGQIEGGADVWGAGLALCELCGVELPPISLANLRNDNSIEQKVQGLVSEISEKSPEMADLVSKMLAVDPGERISAEDALGHPAMENVMSPKAFMGLVDTLSNQ